MIAILLPCILLCSEGFLSRIFFVEFHSMSKILRMPLRSLSRFGKPEADKAAALRVLGKTGA